MDSRRLVVAADDRTGALETAGAIADAGLSAVMVPWVPGLDDEDLAGHLTAALSSSGADVLVVDLASRHTTPRVAASRAASVLAVPAERSAHKIDSTLRGNWAHELGALVGAGRRVLLVPAFPAAGRTCVGGAVLEHGIPVTERHAASDIRGPVGSSLPAEHLRAAGVGTVAMLADASTAAQWLASPAAPSVGVCDASTDDDLRALCEAWIGADADVVLAGTAAAIGAGAVALLDVTPRPPTGSALARPVLARPVLARPVLARPVLVVAGSAYPIVRVQTDSLIRLGATVHVVDQGVDAQPLPGSSIVVLRAADASGNVSTADALEMAQTLATHACAWLAIDAFATLVIVGGDTAAAVLGHSAMAVGGTLAPGMPWCRMLVEGAASGPIVVTKPGGFGGADALAALLAPVASGAAVGDL